MGRLFKMLLKAFLTIFLLLTTVALGAFVINEVFINRVEITSVAGTGSMYPTFPKGTSNKLEINEKSTVANPKVLLYPNGLQFGSVRYFEHKIVRGDIVTFNKEGFDADGYIKRVIGLPGDTVELRSGLVYINGDPLKEAYTNQPHSTFGGSFIPECRKISVPAESYVVLGDNRKESNDSRFDMHFVSREEIDGVITITMQEEQNLDKNWRNTDRDLDESSKIKLDINALVARINFLREGLGVEKLTHSDLLDKSTVERGQVILKTGDFSFEGLESKISAKEAMEKHGYYNIALGEIPIQGYYTSDELINNFIEFEDSKQFILNTDFDDIGVGVVEGSLNDCPTQLIVLHFGGYLPPNYSKEVIDSWANLLRNLKEIQPGWENLRSYEGFYQEHKESVDRIVEIIETRIENIEPISDKFSQRVWLSKEEEQYLEYDKSLADEQNKLADYLNNL